MHAMILTFSALLLAHLLADFPLQPGSIARNKGTSLRAWIFHGIIHYVVAWSAVLFFAHTPFGSTSAQLLMAGYAIAHLAVDKVKSVLIGLGRLRDDIRSFLIDQAIHIVMLTIVAVFLTGTRVTTIVDALQPSPSTSAHILSIAVVYVGVVFGGGYLIRYFTRGLSGGIQSESPGQLANAGLYIGWIERCLVVTAIVMQSPALVGLILTGKSIARFPEFKEARFAEYFLIGTLTSILFSVFGGVVLLKLLYGGVSLK